MEEKIKEAKEKFSWSGLACKLFSSIGILASIIYIIIQSSDNSKSNFNLIKNTSILVGSSLAIGAIGSIAGNTKKNMSLTALLVESTNSASQLQLPMSDYSDLNEDN